MGFLHTGATFAADLNLVVQLAMGAALVLGMYLARKKKFRQHARCQTSVVLLNLVMIVLIMAPSLHSQVYPNMSRITTDRYYALPALHAAIGTLGEVLGLYVILVAGTKIVPKGLRFRKYKPWMRATLAVWSITIGLGIATYVVWYTAEQPVPVMAATPPQAEPAKDKDAVKITIENFKFTPKEVTIKVGTTVVWTDLGGRHTVQTNDGYIKSDTLTADKTYEKKFDKAGVFQYYCDFHGAKASGMSGTITVE